MSASVRPMPRSDLAPAQFHAVRSCWICGGRRLDPIHECLFDLQEFGAQDPELAAYSGARLWIARCVSCGFGQPTALPTLQRFFERMYDQRWSDEWLAGELASDAKRLIFTRILDELERRLPPGRRRLVDVGAHVGQFVQMAGARGWRAEGIELNPTAAEYAGRHTGLVVHRRDVRALAETSGGAIYDAVTLTDVLEHIPEPCAVLKMLRPVVAPGGCVAVKVPCGANQLRKERIRKALGRGGRISVADNLVHVNHFSVRSLRLGLERAGFVDVEVEVGLPEMLDAAPARAARLALYHAARATGGARSPLAFNLQAFARVSSHGDR